MLHFYKSIFFSPLCSLSYSKCFKKAVFPQISVQNLFRGYSACVKRKASVSDTICSSWSLSLETCSAAARTASMNCRVLLSFNTLSSFCCFNTFSLLSAFLPKTEKNSPIKDRAKKLRKGTKRYQRLVRRRFVKLLLFSTFFDTTGAERNRCFSVLVFAYLFADRLNTKYCCWNASVSQTQQGI